MLKLVGTVVDCPKPLRTGNNIVLSLRAYFLPSAFRKTQSFEDDNQQKVWWDEGAETLDEQMLRERKESLQHLFDAVSLRAVRASGASHSSGMEVDIENVPSSGSKQKEKARAVEVIGDDEDAEEIEVEGEELDDHVLFG